VQNEYLGLTVGSVFIIFFTLIYYVIVLVIEICLIACPDTVPIILGAFRCNRRQAAGKKGSKQRRGSSADGGGVGLPGGPGGPGGESDMVVNPFLVRNMEGAAPDSALGEGIVDLKSVMSMSNPTPAMWKAVQHSYDRMYGMITTLRDEVRDAKRATSHVQLEKEALSEGGDKPRRAFRTAFKPTVSAAEAAAGPSTTPRSAGAEGGFGSVVTAVSPLNLNFAARAGASLKAQAAAAGGGRRSSIAARVGVSGRSLRRPGGGGARAESSSDDEGKAGASTSSHVNTTADAATGLTGVSGERTTVMGTMPLSAQLPPPPLHLPTSALHECSGLGEQR